MLRTEGVRTDAQTRQHKRRLAGARDPLAARWLPLAHIGYFVATWLVALLYQRLAVLQNDPFGRLWALYEPVQSASVFALAGCGLAASALIPLPQSGTPPASRKEETPAARRQRFAIVVASFCLMLMIVVKGRYFFYADHYLEFSGGPSLRSLADIFGLAGTTAAGFVSGQKGKRFTGLLLGLGFVTMYFDYSSRALAITPFLYVLGRRLAGRNIKWGTAVLAGMTTLILLPVPLYTRSLSSQGLVSFVEALSTAPLAPYRVGFLALIQSVGLSAPVTSFTAFLAGPIPHAAFWSSVSPLPSGFVDWAHWAPILRVNFYIPFSAVGELYNQSPFVLIFYMFVLGLVYRWGFVRLTHVAPAAAPLYVALCSLCFLYSGQYNLRSLNRLLSILILFSIATYIGELVRSRHAQNVCDHAM